MKTKTIIATGIALALGGQLFRVVTAADQEVERFNVVQTQVATVAHQAQLLRDEKQIEKLQRSYGYYIDKKLWDQVADLFADDGTMELGQNGVYIGKAHIRRAFEQISSEGLKDGELFNHMQLQPIVHVAADGKTAAGRWRGLNQAGEYGKRAIWGEGVYENEYVKENGVWKIKSLHYYASFTTPYEKGWAKEVLPVRREVASGFEPDRPPTLQYEAFPKYFVPPFHFVHPVTGKPPRAGAGGQKSAAASSATQAGQSTGRAATIAELEQAVVAAEREIRRIQDENEIENLIGAYGYYLDKSLWDQLAGLFADSGSIELAQRGVYVGKQRVRALLDTFGPQGPRYGHLANHIQIQPIIDVADDGLSAKIRSRALLQIGEYGGEASWGEGVYENEAIKEGGVWKFKAVHFFNTFATDYNRGWAKSALKIRGLDPRLPPDRPPTLVYQQYPKAFVPPFHYKNPVSGR
jgi:hypothetical protein